MERIYKSKNGQEFIINEDGSVTRKYNTSTTISELLKLSKQGDVKAQEDLATCYFKGKGVERNYFNARWWYEKAADKGSVLSQFMLGSIYENGKGVSPDPKCAVYWYRKAAEQGFAPAQNNLGLCYTNGTGVAQDTEQARYWLRKAIANGCEPAKKNLKNLNTATNLMKIIVGVTYLITGVIICCVIGAIAH